MNQVTLIGHLGQDAEVRSTQSGKKVANLRVATSEKFKDRNSGEIVEKTDWHNVVVWGSDAEDLGNATKGDKVAVSGKLQTRKWTDKDGNERYVTEVVVEWPRGHVVIGVGRKASGGGNTPNPLDDGIPF